MSKLEVLCVTMHQTDFSKVREMNLHTDVVFANQADRVDYAECEFDGHKARMLTTATRGVGKNRNFALLYASAEYCLLADDDVVYRDDMESSVISAFEAHPDADVMIFHFDSVDSRKKMSKNKTTKKVSLFHSLPWGGVNIAFRLNSIRKSNVWFTTLFGGGCVFPSGEDSMFLTDLRKSGLRIYVTDKTIGNVSYATSTWFTGYDPKYYYGKGAFYQAARPTVKYFWMLYMILRTYNKKDLSVSEKLRWMINGAKGYQQMLSFAEYEKMLKNKGKHND